MWQTISYSKLLAVKCKTSTSLSFTDSCIRYIKVTFCIFFNCYSVFAIFRDEKCPPFPTFPTFFDFRFASLFITSAENKFGGKNRKWSSPNRPQSDPSFVWPSSNRKPAFKLRRIFTRSTSSVSAFF